MKSGLRILLHNIRYLQYNEVKLVRPAIKVYEIKAK